jgi:hypothetical protein
MHYVPGFTNYLQASVPAYANGGAVMGDPRQAAVMPMTQQAVAPNYLSGLGLSDAELASLYALSSSGNFNQGNYGSDFGSLDNVYGMNFGSDLGSGGSGGGLYKVNPYMQTFQAPLSDKGNSTASAGGGIDVKSPTQVFRLLDKNTGEVVYEGVGYEGAQEAINRASALTAEQGAKAQWQIQTPNSQQESGYSVVANEKRSQSTVGDIASFALPIAMAIATAGASLPAQMAAAGLAGAAGAGLAGKSPLKAGLISAATAGLGNVSGANEAIGKAVGSVGGALAAKTTEEVAKTAAEKAAEQIIVTGLSKAAQGAGSAIGNTLLSQGLKGGLSEVTGYKTPAEKYTQQTTPAVQPPVDMYAGLDPIDVLASRSYLSPEALAAVMGAGGLTAATAGNVGAGSNVVDGVDQDTGDIVVNKYRPINPPGGLAPISILGAGLSTGSILNGLGPLNTLPSDPALMEPDALPDDIVVTGMESLTPAELLAALGGAGGLAAATAGGGAPTDTAAAEKAKADAEAKKKLGVEDYLSIGSKAVGLLGNLVGGGGKNVGQTGTYGGSGTGRLNPIFSAKLPSAGGLGLNRTARPMGDVDWLTYGTRPELRFFDYAPATPAPITTPVPGNPAGPIMAEDKIRHSEEGIPLWMQLGLPNPNAPATQAAGQIMEERDPMAMAEGGAFAAKRGGRSQRTEFAVNGAGTGRSDDIPAVLSDGEYVIDAETVALLGDGSSKAGAKKLDELRIKVRKHKGKKLAKGRFSANAKRPEAYLSGGRI